MDIATAWAEEPQAPKMQPYKVSKPTYNPQATFQQQPTAVPYYPQYTPDREVRSVAMSANRVEDKKAQEERDNDLLNKLNEMFGSTEELVVAKMNELHRATLKHTERVIKENTPAPCIDWIGIICLVLLLALFVSYVVMEQCNFKKVMTAINKAQLKSVDLKVMYPQLYS